MPAAPFRFLHASDFHLEAVARGVPEVPDHLAELFVEAQYAAAEQVFESALNEEVDFVVFSGDLLQPGRTGPRGPLFLVDQVNRLAERGIPVYWAGGGTDPPEVWPAALTLPGCVHRFPVGRVEAFTFERDGVPLARIRGVSRDRGHAIRAGQFQASDDDLFTIAVVHGSAQADALAVDGVDYWALGGSHDRRTLLDGPHWAHCPGTPQGRSPRESGPHGCTLVSVDTDGRVRTALRPSDVMRWLSERVIVDETTGHDGLRMLLRERMHTLIETAPNMDLLVTWAVAGTGPLLGALRHGSLTDELLQWLRTEYGYGPPAAWSLSLEVEPSAPLPAAWYEQETLCGDYLRALRQLELDAKPATDLDEEPTVGTLPDQLIARLQGVGDMQQQRLLREAALLGADLLQPEEIPS